MHSQLWLYLDEGLAALPIYAFGTMLYPHVKRYCSPTTERERTVGIVVLALSFAFCVSLFYGLFNYTIVPLGSYSCPNYLVALISMVVCCPFVLWIASLLRNIKVLKMLGEKTLGIMLIHAPMCHTAAVILNRLFVKGSLIWISTFLVAYVVIVIVSYQLTVLLERHVPILLGKEKSVIVKTN